jgi:ring-1,2-phenylacetyl-CoA epoxidase subunit PaaD
VPVTLAVRCPHCGSTDTALLSRFSSTACKSLRRCGSCREPFDHFKEV